MKRTYGQFCALARALDVVGERWTLLLVRELLLGPRRYGQLLEGLPGIGTNLLAQRLRDLEAAGLVRRTGPGDGARTVAYELTERGRALDAAVLDLARWGMEEMAPPAPGERRQPAWYALALRAAFRPPGTDEAYELRAGDDVFHLRVRDGEAYALAGPAPDAAVTLAASDADALLELATGARDPGGLEAEGRLRVAGDRAALERWRAAFRLPLPVG